MNKFKGTSGEWEIHESRSRGFCITSGGFGEGMKVVSGCIDEYDHLGSVNNIHDATLIASAPSLLEELQLTLGSLEEICAMSNISRPESTIRRARAAIAKALGDI